MLGTDISLVIVGNKVDLEKQRNVPVAVAEECVIRFSSKTLETQNNAYCLLHHRYALSVGAKHFQTSAKQNKGVEELFLDLTKSKTLFQNHVYDSLLSYYVYISWYISLLFEYLTSYLLTWNSLFRLRFFLKKILNFFENFFENFLKIFLVFFWFCDERNWWEISFFGLFRNDRAGGSSRRGEEKRRWVVRTHGSAGECRFVGRVRDGPGKIRLLLMNGHTLWFFHFLFLLDSKSPPFWLIGRTFTAFFPKFYEAFYFSLPFYTATHHPTLEFWERKKKTSTPWLFLAETTLLFLRRAKLPAAI